MRRLVLPSPQRLEMLIEALKKGARPEELSSVTGIGRTVDDANWVIWRTWTCQLSELKDQSPPPASDETRSRSRFQLAPGWPACWIFQKTRLSN
jgi:hypothetical protein